MRFPAEFKYSKDHEWARITGNTVIIGITDHAQSALGDVVYCELPKVGRELKKGEVFGVVESIKAVSDLYSPVSGKVIAINQSVVDNPSELNGDPHGSAWMIKVELSEPVPSADLMDSASYEKYVASLK
jgi:glycine cleavage system H protein